MQATASRSDHRSTLGVFALLTIASLLPVLLTPIPAMVDYPNHLARMYILSETGGPNANPFYEATWAPYPNLAMDLIIPQFARLMSVEDATRLFLFLSQLLIIGGALALEWVVKRRFQLAGFVALLFLYCLPFSWGFLNFQFGLGLMLGCVAGYLGIFERAWPIRLLVNALSVVVLFAAHFFVLGVYGVTLGICEIKRAYDRRLSISDVALRLFVLAMPAVLLLIVMKLNAGSVGAEGTLWGFEYKPIWPLRILNGYNLTIAAVSALALAVFIYVAAKNRVLRLDSTGAWLLAAFAVLYLLIPSMLVRVAFTDLRMIPAAALLLAAFCGLSLPNRRWTLTTLLVVSGVTAANLGIVYWVWLSYRADYAAMIKSFDRVERGSLILSANSGDDEDPPFNDLTRYPMSYAPALAVHYAQAFVPNLYAEIGKQPLRVRPAYQRLAMPTAGLVPLRVLTAIATQDRPVDVPASIATWQRDFNYLYVLGPHVPNPMPNLLEELDRSGRFVLYRIRRTP